MKSIRIITDFAITSSLIQAGGIESSAELAVLGLRKNNIEVIPVHFRIMQSQLLPEMHTSDSSVGKIFELQTPIDTRSAFSDEHFSWRPLDQAIVESYKKLFHETKPDLILINGFPWFQHYLALSAQEAKIPYVVIHHGLVFKELPYVNIPKIAQKRIAQWEHKDSQRAAGEIFITKQSQNVWQSQYPDCDEQKHSLIPLPIDPSFFFAHKQKQTNHHSKIQKLGWIGRWDAIKRPEYVFALAKILNDTHEIHAVTKITSNPKVPVSNEIFSNLVTTHQPMGLNELRDFYFSLDACILPSAFESMGKVILEAAMCGAPTFITNEVCLADIYRETGMSAFILSGNDVERDAEIIRLQKGKKCTDAFINYIVTEHHPDIAYPRLSNTIKKIVRK